MEVDVCIIGAGPAGLMAAIFSAIGGAKTVVFEANTTAGRKLLLTGGSRCNITHLPQAGSIGDFVKAFGEKYRFVQHCLYKFSPQDLRKFFAGNGLPTKVQKDGCVFPVTERSSNVRDVLVAEAKRKGVVFIYGSRIEKIDKTGAKFATFSNKETLFSKKVIIATGGLSYPQTGSTGDGYRFAQRFGHTIIEPKPALVPLAIKENWPRKLAGTALPAVKSTAKTNNKKITSTGNMLFTQDGIGGPAVLDFSRLITDYLSADKKPIPVSIDTMANTYDTELEKRFLKLCEENPKKSVKGILAIIYPQRFALVFCEEFGFAGDRIARQLEKSERKRLIKLLKSLPLTITAARPISEATITHGGVSTDEIDSKTMESLVCPGLYFAGEVIDIDGPCGGFNLQFAFSSGCLAGKSAVKTILEAK